MITLKEILAVIVKKIKEEFKDISINSQDIDEITESTYKKKIFYVYFDNITSTDYMKKLNEKNLTVRIVYFPEHEKRNSLEILEVQNKLINLFSNGKTIQLNDYLFSDIEEVETVKSGGVLHFNFDIYIFDEYPEVETETMDNLEIKGVN